MEHKLINADELIGIIKQLPISGVMRTGQWHTLYEYKVTKLVECTHCNTEFRYKKNGTLIVDAFPYCPACGAEMIGGTK